MSEFDEIKQLIRYAADQVDSLVKSAEKQSQREEHFVACVDELIKALTALEARVTLLEAKFATVSNTIN